MLTILQKADICQQLLSGSSYPTLQFAIPAIKHLQSEWEAIQDRLRAVNSDDPVIAILGDGLEKLAAYYKKMEASEAYGNALSKCLSLLYSIKN
jgi:hypothetical protein